MMPWPKEDKATLLGPHVLAGICALILLQEPDISSTGSPVAAGTEADHSDLLLALMCPGI